MEDIIHALRIGEYDQARTLIKQLHHEEKMDLIAAASEIVDDGSAMRMIIGEGHCLSIMRKPANKTPMHVLVQKGNVHAVREIMKIDVGKQLTQEEQDQCFVMAAEFGQRPIVNELLRGLSPSPIAVERAMCESINYRHAGCAELIFFKFYDIVAPLFPGLLEQILRLMKNRSELADFACRAISLFPCLASTVTADKLSTPLHIACSFKNKESPRVVRCLVDNGAHLDVPDCRNRTALDVAYMTKNKECLKILLAVPDSPIFRSCTKSTASSVYSYIVYGDDMQLVDMMLTGNKQLRTSATLLFQAMDMKCKYLFSHLISTYPDIAAARGFNHRNALMYAIYNNLDRWYFDIILRHGRFSLSDVDAFGHNVAHYASTARNEYYIDELRKRAPYLFYGVSESGQLPVDCAKYLSESVIRRMLLFNKSQIRRVDKNILSNALREAPRVLIGAFELRQSLLEVLFDVACEDFVAPKRKIF